MWNYSFEVPLLMILGIILAFYFSRPRLSLKRNRVFVLMIVVETLTILTDLAATAVDINFADYPVYVVKGLNMLYFVAFFSRAYIMYRFAASVMKDTLEKRPVFRVFIRLPMHVGVILALISFFFGSEQNSFIYYADETGYHSGSLYGYLYVCGFIYVLLAFISSFLFRNRLGRRREKYSMFFYNVILLASLCLRFAMPRYLIMDTCIFMAILAVFLAFENPEYYLDLKSVTFNSLALSEYLEETIDNIRLIPMGVVVYNYREMREIYGYPQMEAGLMMIGRYLKQSFPKGKVFYYANGRFLVMAHPNTDFYAKSREVLERFKGPWKSKTTELYLSPGIALFNLAGGKYSAEIILSTMVWALDSVGETGNVTTFTEDNLKEKVKEKQVKNSIEAALDRNALELYLQPIMDSETGKVVGAEALSRIRDLDGNIIPPGVFIPIAETSGRINELGEMVFDRACRFLSEEDIGSMGLEWINVNLSPSQFIRTDLAERYSAIVDKYGIDPGLVHLEITEGSMIDDSFLQKQMGAMTGSGFKFALDDYGTGFSNLSRLKKCPFVNVKLDMSIVWDYCKEPEEILPNMIRAFKNMGFNITAEGIEDDNMSEIMRNIGCDYLQGYHYSKPMPEQEFAARYKAQK